MAVKDWGRMLVELRGEAGLSQRQLAARAQINRLTLSRLERGLARGEVEFLERAFGYLGYELDAVLREAAEEIRRQQREMETDPVRRSRMAFKRLLELNVA